MKRATSKKKRLDAQLREFKKKDLGDDIARSKSAVVIRPKTRQMPTSIFLTSPMVIAKLKEKLFVESRKFAREKGLKKSDVAKAIRRVRSKQREWS